MTRPQPIEKEPPDGMARSYRCISPNQYVYVNDVLSWDPKTGLYRSRMSLSKAWHPSVLMAPNFSPMRRPKFGDLCSVVYQSVIHSGYVIEHELRNMHTPMTTVVLEMPNGYKIECFIANQVKYVDPSIDPLQ